MTEGETPLRRKAIVVVEDNETIAQLIGDTLNAEPDYQAALVHDGSLALDVVRSVKASLILLDIELPGIDGLQLYDILHADEATRGIPVIFVTASVDTREFKKRGITSYITKPFDLDELLDKVAMVCRANPQQTEA